MKTGKQTKTADERRYRAEFVGVKTREELIHNTNVINEDIYRFKEAA